MTAAPPVTEAWELLTPQDLIAGFVQLNVQPLSNAWLQAEPDCTTVYACAVGELALLNCLTRSEVCTADGAYDDGDVLFNQLADLGYPQDFCQALSDGYEAEASRQREFPTDPQEDDDAFAAMLDEALAHYSRRSESYSGYSIGATVAHAVRPLTRSQYDILATATPA